MKSRIAIPFQAVLFAILAHALLAAALPAESVSVDFGKQTATSSYLIFGGCSPNPAHTKARDLLAKAGVTFLRFDVKCGAHPDPKNIALDDYRSSMGKRIFDAVRLHDAHRARLAMQKHLRAAMERF